MIFPISKCKWTCIISHNLDPISTVLIVLKHFGFARMNTRCAGPPRVCPSETNLMKFEQAKSEKETNS